MTTTCLLVQLLIWTIIAVGVLSNFNKQHRELMQIYRIRPLAYTLIVGIDDNFYVTKSFTALCITDFRATENFTENENLILKAKGLNIFTISLFSLTDEEKNCTCKYIDSERISVITNKTLKMGEQYRLSFFYTGIINTDFNGLYMDSYRDNGGETWYLATHLKPASAHWLFPYFDDPGYKTPFTLNVSHPKAYQVYSNKEINSVTELEDTIKTTHFNWTDEMSAYLFAFVISKFNKFEWTDDGVTYRVLSRSGLNKTYGYATQISPSLVNIFRDITGISYSWITTAIKIDQVALPGSPSMVVESYGLLTYREDALLWNEEQSGAVAKQKVGTAIAHGIAHLWFGNLKTCEWWNVAWLNEGFATFFQYYALDKVEDNWELSYQFVVEKFQSVLIEDSSSKSIPLSSPKEEVSTNHQVREKLGEISYSKGASIIRMMMMFMGEDLFYKGIKEYIYMTKTKTLSMIITPYELWFAWFGTLDYIMPKQTTLVDVMSRWTESPGFPIVSVERKRHTVALSAVRLTYQSSQGPYENVWHIPISYTTSRNPNFERTAVNKDRWIIGNGTLTLNEDLTSDNLWIVVNLQSSAFVRVNYDTFLWKALEGALKKNYSQIHVLNRAQIVDDVLELARIAELSYSTSLSLLLYLKNEVEYYPWFSALRGFNKLKRSLDGNSDDLEALHKFVRSMSNKFYNSISGSTHKDTLKKVLATTLACGMRNKACQKKLHDSFVNFIENDKEVEPDLRSITYCTGIRLSRKKKYWNALYKRLKETNIPSEVVAIVEALGCTGNADLLELFLNETIISSTIKAHSHKIFQSVAENSRRGTNIALSFLLTHWGDIVKYHQYSETIPYMLKVLGDTIRTEKQLNKLEELVQKPKDQFSGDADRAISQAKENIMWERNRKKSFLAVLKTHVPIRRSGTFGLTSSKTLLVVFIAIAIVLNYRSCYFC